MMELRDKLREALNKPQPDPGFCGEVGRFDPWGDVIQGISGDYASESDDLMIATLVAVRDRTTFNLIKQHGFIVEFMLYVLAGHGLINYGTSPRCGWPDESIADLWDELIEKWKAYSSISWSYDD